MEVQTKSSLPHLLTTAENCQQKYHDLHRRFTTTATTCNEHDIQENNNNNNNNDNNSGDKVANIPWLEELRKLRVAELKQELKVKRLEEEREKSVQGNQNDDGGIPDLEQEASQNDKKDEPEKKDSLSGGEESDRENRSVNESNSTGSEQKTAEKDGVKMEAEPVQEGPCEAAPVLSVSNSKPVGGGGEESHELGDSVTQLSSEETDAYKNMVRQHLDLETIETKLEQGSYSSSNLSFYRDLLLLVNNAIVFFPKSSTESLAAYELRLLLSNEMKKESQKSEFTVASQNIASQPKSELERSNSLLKGSAPIVVCRKRSSLSAKPSSSGYGQKIEQQQQPQQSNDTEQPSDPKPTIVEQSTMKIESKEKPATGTRSSRRTNKNLTKVTSAPSKKQNASPTTKADADKPETPKTDKKKTEALALDKKRSAVDFLKRIKKNSPVETSKNTRGGVNGSGDKKTDGTGR
ncbi:hypothetical protein GH714_014933 [Hevea brasiliensis]|uniref:Bromo domain-containing protein n=1 Tax=Hevea brasiliensis TaxID=3981 RepID=A0A6A6N3C7_HEVBR|nr:hypothetical protein GH714_014933 [Hevea brasiliensis]